MNFKFKPFSIQAGIACMREVMSSILIISITRGDIAQLVERLLSINAYFFFVRLSQHPPTLHFARVWRPAKRRTGSEQDFRKFFSQKRTKRAVGRLRGMGGGKKIKKNVLEARLELATFCV